MSLVTSIRAVLLVLCLSVLLPAQRSSQQGTTQPPEASAPQAVAQPPFTRTNDALAQFRDDLNKMESLIMNMSSEIEFLHDQNLQILLRTNAQMWTLLIRDLRRQVQAEEQQRGVAPPASSK